MNSDTTPRHIETRMLAALNDLKGLATDRGLEDVIAFELYVAEQHVRDAIQSKDRRQAEDAMTEVRAVAMQLAHAASHSQAREPQHPAITTWPCVVTSR